MLEQEEEDEIEGLRQLLLNSRGHWSFAFACRTCRLPTPTSDATRREAAAVETKCPSVRRSGYRLLGVDTKRRSHAAVGSVLVCRIGRSPVSVLPGWYN